MKRYLSVLAVIAIFGMLIPGGCAGSDMASSSTVTTGTTETEAATTTAWSTTVLTDPQIADLQTYLNDVANNGFCFQEYTRPEEIDLLSVLYDGAGISQNISELSEQEQADVLAATPWTAYETDCQKLKRSDIDSLLKKKIGVSLDLVIKGMDQIGGFHYVEKYDAYYTMHGDTMCCPLKIYSGKINLDGQYIITYGDAYGSSDRCVLTLQKTGDEYRFLSNSKV